MKTISSKTVFALVWPLGALFSALKNWRQPWAMNVFWIVCAFLGSIQIFHPEGTILGEGADSGRYVLDLMQMHQTVNSYSEVSSTFYNGDTNDVYCPTIMFLVSRFTDNGHVLFFVFAIIYGFFYSRNIWYILNRIKDQQANWQWVMLASFFLVCPIWNVNGVRMWTALHVFVYGAMPYLLEKKKNQLLWSLLALFVHHSFIFPIILLVVFVLFLHRLCKYRASLNILFVFYVFSLTIKTLDLSALNTALQMYLPNFYEERIDGYVNDVTLQNVMYAASKNSWHVAFFNNIHYWINQILILLTFTIIKKKRNMLSSMFPLFAFSLLIYGCANIMACVPSGARYISIAQMFMVATFLLCYREILVDKVFSAFMPVIMSMLAFSLIFEIRKGLDYYGFTILFGNILLSTIIETNVPLIDFIKNLLV